MNIISWLFDTFTLLVQFGCCVTFWLLFILLLVICAGIPLLMAGAG